MDSLRLVILFLSLLGASASCVYADVTSNICDSDSEKCMSTSEEIDEAKTLRLYELPNVLTSKTAAELVVLLENARAQGVEIELFTYANDTLGVVKRENIEDDFSDESMETPGDEILLSFKEQIVQDPRGLETKLFLITGTLIAQKKYAQMKVFAAGASLSNDLFELAADCVDRKEVQEILLGYCDKLIQQSVDIVNSISTKEVEAVVKSHYGKLLKANELESFLKSVKTVAQRKITVQEVKEKMAANAK